MKSSAALSVFGQLDPPIWLLTTKTQRSQGGLIATFVSQASISLAHPRVIVGLAKHHHTWRLVEEARRFVLHLLGINRVDVVARFGLRTGHEFDKMADSEWEQTPGGLPRLPNPVGWLECRVETTLDTGDRTLYLAAIRDGDLRSTEPPLTVRSWLALASEDEKREAKRLMEQDQKIDADAIEQWRKEK